ncbi:enoyl-CoA hydratase/isomerase family protein [Azospirillum sp.]|uniref:enoyl-CoA hydratase/isomerase family protein n=1 Tax=Azospirillum sp. TaxID=34012 RepID=UPI002606C614|nr:enoyl-CoA hydratase/isomerase family protein [Azospirillum sp.]
MIDGVRLEIDGAVAVITLDRPDKLGALTPAMLAELERIADRIDQDRAVRVAVLTGQGPKAFCVGADIGCWAALEPLDMWRRWVRDGHRVFDRLARLRQPLIAALNGVALGGGLELAATADLRIAEAHARFGLPECGIATVPGWGGTQRLTRRAGSQTVRRLVLTGDLVTAEEAVRLGLVDQVCPTGEGLAHALELARRIAVRAPIATQLAKQLVNAAEGEESRDATLEAIAGALAGSTADGREGVAAFRDRRTPLFQDQ